MSGKLDKKISESDKHQGDTTALVYNNGTLYSGGADGKIKVWDKDLNLIKTIIAHEAYVYALAMDKSGRLYSSSCDGSIKVFENILNSDDSKELLRCNDFEIESLATYGDILYSGDDKGIVTMWIGHKTKFMFNLVEEIRSLAVEKNTIYSVRNQDVCVTEVMLGESGKYATKGTIPGHAPLILFGPKNNERSSWISCVSRDGKGMGIYENTATNSYKQICKKENAHELIINAMCGTDKFLYTSGWDGIVKKWSEIPKDFKLNAEVKIGGCMNVLCNGEQDCVYAGGSDGMISKILFY